MNQRNNHRIVTPLFAELVVNASRYRAEVGNISLAGARLACGLPGTDVGTTCRLILSADDGDQAQEVAVDGRIVYCDDSSCAISFVAVEARSFAHLIRWLGRRAEEPTALRDEIERGAIPELASGG